MRAQEGHVTPDVTPEPAAGPPSAGPPSAGPLSAGQAPAPSAPHSAAPTSVVGTPNGAVATRDASGGTAPRPSAAPVSAAGFVAATAPDTWCQDATAPAGASEEPGYPAPHPAAPPRAEYRQDPGHAAEADHHSDLAHAGHAAHAGHQSDSALPGHAADPAHTQAAHDAREPVRRPGRPRSERAEQAILAAAIEAVGENGIDGISCEDVAARAGVGKATLYRRWQGKEDLLIAAFAAIRRPLPEPRGESVRADLIALLAVIAADSDDPRFAQQWALLHGAGERYPRLVARYKERVIEPRRERVRSLLRRGIATGELRPDTNVEVAMLMLTGAVMGRVKHDPAPAAPGFVESLIDTLLHGIATPPQP